MTHRNSTVSRKKMKTLQSHYITEYINYMNNYLNEKLNPQKF